MQTVVTGLVVAIVGFFSSFPILLTGIEAMGADAAQSASGLMMAAISMGLTAIVLSLRFKMPLSVAWSTPGAALLAVTAAPIAGFAEATGAFLIAGLLTIASGAVKPLRELATSVPTSLAQAMLAGVLATICMAPFLALADAPQVALPIILTWFVVGRFSRIFAVPSAVIAALVVTLVDTGGTLDMPSPILSIPVFTMPVFSVASTIGIALPLFIVTMATQNIPGIAVLRGFGFSPPPGASLAGVGAASALSAPFGAPATCLAAITAAMCSDEHSHPDHGLRYWSAVMGGVFYCLFGMFAVVITTVAALAPPQTLATLAGVALLGVFSGSASAALENPKEREAASITFLITVSGMTLFGLGAAVWGLVAGGIVWWFTARRSSA